MLQDPRLNRKIVRVPRRDDYEKRPVLSATIHPDLKRTLVAMSERTGGQPMSTRDTEASGYRRPTSRPVTTRMDPLQTMTQSLGTVYL